MKSQTNHDNLDLLSEKVRTCAIITIDEQAIYSMDVYLLKKWFCNLIILAGYCQFAVANHLLCKLGVDNRLIRSINGLVTTIDSVCLGEHGSGTRFNGEGVLL